MCNIKELNEMYLKLKNNIPLSIDEVINITLMDIKYTDYIRKVLHSTSIKDQANALNDLINQITK